MRRRHLGPLQAVAAALMLLVASAGLAAYGESATGTTPNPDPWPRQIHIDGATMTVYQPQVDSWDGGFLKFRAAVALKPDGSQNEIFGVIRASAHTLVDKSSRMVKLFNFSLLHVNFPTLTEHGKQYFAAVAKALPSATQQISLDRLQAFLSVEKVTAKTVAVKNEPPQILVSYKPAVLVPVHGDPVLRTIPGTSYQRVMNTGALVVYDASGHIYLHLYDGWMLAYALEGPWQVAAEVPQALTRIAAELSKSGQVDLMTGGKTTPKPSLRTTVPAVYVTTVPTELIVFKGEPWFSPIADTDLLWVTNSSGDVIMDTDNNDYYVLISGRWFHAPKLSGPWTFVASSDLPADFRKIPANSPAARVLTAVAGTAQAKEAVIANSVPQTAVVPRKGGPEYKPTIDGAPQLRPIEGTPLQYVANSPDAIIQVSPTSYYALRSGVWFTASSLQGPWSVATFVPEVIYTIPPSSPLHYVTYVDIYWVSPESVEIGYTPGYMGTVVTTDGTVVYGTGYDYTGWVGDVYYPPPPTYGYAVYPAFDVAEGAMVGYDMGWATASYMVEPAPVWGPVYYGYYGDYWGYHGYYPYGPYYGYNTDHPCCYYNTGYDNVYGHYGNTTYNGYHDYGYNPYTGNTGETSAYHTYNSATGTSSNIHSYSGYNAYTGTEGAGYNRSFHNQNTGTSGDVDRNAAYNPETGNFERNGSGSAYNPNTGSSADVQHTNTGNAYNGSSAGETTATVTNGKTGQTNTYGAAHNGNDVYAGSDGNVYRNTGSGWQENTGNGWQSTGSNDNSDLDRFSQARSSGESRYNSFSSRGFYGGGGGGGGGFRRFGR
jgi:hypothetical protein